MPQTTVIDLQQSLLLSERDRAAFFEALVHPPKPNERMEGFSRRTGESHRLIDAIDEHAAKFYAARGFFQLPESMRLILHMRAISVFIQP